MSLKRYAMLAAISYHNQQHYNNKNNNTQGVIATITEELTTTPEAGIATATSMVTIPTITTEKIINSNKSTLIQLKQQSQHHQQTDIVNKTTLTQTPPTPPSTTISTTTTRWFNSDNPTFYRDHTHTGSSRSSSSSRSSDTIISDDSTSAESSESTNIYNDYVSSTSLNGGAVGDGQRHQQQHTYGTTYYGSGFGVFHQQNIRSNNGGGIALITGGSGNSLGSSSYSNGINNNVNLLLGGAMLTLITTILCVVCYCCHRNIKKRTEAAYRQQHQWLENDPNMEIYSVEQCYETSGLFVGDSMDGLATIPTLHHEPPPSYDAVVAMQEQQQLLMQQQQLMMQQQQQQLMQQLPNNSPPPGYRSSLDVSSMIQQTRGGLAMRGLNGMESNSLASSTLNVRPTTSHSPIDSLGNYNDLNSNMPVALAATSNQLSQPNYLRNKQQRTNLSPANLTQLNMKKVLQAQSCCSLQRAEVENMWNAAAAALAARSAHNPPTSEPRATASTSSPTLVLNTRKLSQDQMAAAKTNTPETFGSRYLKQNYYRSGCPLCGKFRYDNDSTFSISMESNLDNLTATSAIGVETTDVGNVHLNSESEQVRDNFINNNLTNDMDGNNDDGCDIEDDVELECSCNNSNRKQEQQNSTIKSLQKQEENTYQSITIAPQDNKNNITTAERRVNLESPNQTDDNCNNTIEQQKQSKISNPTSSLPSNNNNDSLTEASGSTLPTIASTSTACGPTAATLTPGGTSSPSVTIDLDCINENGIISLDMSKIIDKTGLPTYDAALKLESSGYV